jgi:hypothetical protein
MAEGNGAEFRAECEAQLIRPISEGYEVIYEPSRGRTRKAIRAKVVIVAGGTIHSPALLLRSKGYLPLLSDQVGKNLSGNGDIALGGLIPGVDFEVYKGKIMGSVTYGWWDEGIVLKPAFALPMIGAAQYPAHLEGASPPYYWGLEHKYMMKEYGNHIIFIAGLGLDGRDGVVTINRRGNPELHWETSQKSQAIYDAQIRAVGQIIEALGGTMIVTPCMETGEVITVHPLGTCRMAGDVSQGVVDENCQVFNYPNLYVVDGSVIPTAVGVSPALTISAIAEKVSGYIRGNLPEKMAMRAGESRQSSSGSTMVFQNYPDPFNADTWIPYQLGQDTDVVVRIHTARGQLVRTLNLGRKRAGLYLDKQRAAYWDGNNELGENLASGVYFYTIHAGDFIATKKLVILE